MRWRAVYVAFACATGCLSSPSVECADGTRCPDGTECRPIAVRDEQVTCARPQELADCDGKPDFTSCPSHPNGRCYSGVCQDGGCGNRVIDLADPSQPASVAEVCDDGNQNPRDGCSSDCMSNETCRNGVLDVSTGEECDDGNGLSHDGCASTCAREAATWTAVLDNVLGDRSGYALAYDPRRERVLLFGGSTPSGGQPVAHNDTLEWDGTQWLRLEPLVSPSPRSAAAMVYDAARDRVVLFGGVTSGFTRLNDTWEWDGTRWSLIAPLGDIPPARSEAAMAYDPILRRTVLHGGSPSAASPLGERPSLADTWTWDGVRWTKIVGTLMPAKRFGHALAFEPTRGVLVMFGGEGEVVYDDTWELDGAGWRHRDLASPPPGRIHHAMSTDPISGHVIIAGGTATTQLDDVWEFDGTQWISRGVLPAPAAGTRIAPLPTLGRLVTVQHGKTYERSGTQDAWSERDDASMTVPLPGRLTGHSVAVDTARGDIVLFGGRTNQTPNAETRIWNGRWRLGPPAASAPPARLLGAMAYDPVRARVVLFGGQSSVANWIPMNDTWLFDGTTWSPSNATGPAARTGAAMAFDPVSKKVVLFGGDTSFNNSGALNDTWLWDGTSWSPGPVAPAAMRARSGASIAVDPKRNRLVLFGGSAGTTVINSTLLDDTWEWDGGTWVEIPTTVRPPARSDAAMAYDPARGRILLFGGADSGSSWLADAWEWEGTAWSLIPIAGAIPQRSGHSLVTAPRNRGLFLYGGGTDVATQFSDHLTLRRFADQSFERCGRNDTDGDMLAGCADPDCWPTCAPACPPGVTCTSALQSCGNAACGSTESCATCSVDCGACPVLCGDLVCDGNETCMEGCP